MDKVTSADGTLIAYVRSGSGKPLLLVHGTTADHRRWATVLPRFEQHFTVFAMDRRGRGGSGDSPEYAVRREAEDVAAMVEAITLQTGEPADVLAHSYGAVCSLEAALLTDHINRLILYEPPLPVGLRLYKPGLPERIQALIDGDELEAALEVFFREEVKMPEHELIVYRSLPMWKERIKITPTLVREMVLDHTYIFDATRFARLEVPTLLLLGSESPMIFQRAIATLDAALPRSHVVILQGEQHIAMDNNPELFLNEVMLFLRPE